MKPNLSLDAKQFKIGQSSLYKPQPISESLPKPNLFGRQIERPKHEVLIDKAKQFMEDRKLRSLEGLMSFNQEGTSILREINAMLTKIVDKQRTLILASKDKELSTSLSQQVYTKEFQSGEKLVQILSKELAEIDRTYDKVKDPQYVLG